MEFSEKIDLIAPAMVKLHNSVADVKVDGQGAFANKYASIGAVLEATKKPLFDCGLALYVFMDDCQGKPAITCLLMHTSGQWAKSTTPLVSAKQDAQGICGAVTYYKRYAICSMLGITNDEDDDGEMSQGRGKHPDNKPAKTEKQTQTQIKVEPPKPTDFISKSNLDFLKIKLKQYPKMEENIKNTFKIDSIEKLKVCDYETVVAKIKEIESLKNQSAGVNCA